MCMLAKNGVYWLQCMFTFDKLRKNYSKDNNHKLALATNYPLLSL